MMQNIRTLRSLALFTSCLAIGACGDDGPKKDKPKASEVVSVVSASQLEAAALTADKKLELEALTAAAPARPGSVLDAPPPQKKPETELVDQIDFSHEEPEAGRADHDRPLTAAEVKVDRFVLANGIDRREPLGESDIFSTDTKRIFAFIELENETAPYALEVHFEKIEGPKSRYGVKLEVPTAERYRTWAWTQIKRRPGQYRAVLRTRQGEEIASRQFTITEAAESE